MRKADLVQRIAAELGCTIGQADAAVEAILTTIKTSLQQGDPVIVRRFGRWQVRTTRARAGRNPKTGAAAAIPARRGVRCVVSQTLQQAVGGVASPADCAGTPRLCPREEHRSGSVAVTCAGPCSGEGHALLVPL